MRSTARHPRSERPDRRPRIEGLAFGKVIAARRIQSAADASLRVTVQIGAPRKTRGRDEYFCAYRITGMGDGKVRAAYGIDAVQALQLVMRAVGSALVRRPDLRWYGNEDLGFPSPR